MRSPGYSNPPLARSLERKRRKMTVYSLGLVVAVVAVLAGLTWVNYHYLVRYQSLTDFAINWSAFRNILFNNQIAYTPELNGIIAAEVEGFVAPGTEVRFVYPLFSMLLFAMYSLIDSLPMAAALWTTTLQVSVVLIILLSMRLFDWKADLLTTGMTLLFGLSFYYVLQPILKGDVIILLTLFLVIALLLLKNASEETAGILLSLLMIKPNVFILPVLMLLIWLLSMGRWRTLAWFVGMIIIYITLGFIFSPNWVIDYLRTIVWFRGVHPQGNLIDALTALFPTFGFRLGWVLSVFLVIDVVLEWFLIRSRSFARVLWLAALYLTIGQVVTFYNDFGNFVVLLPVIVFVVGALARRWRSNGRYVAILLMLLLSALGWYIALRAPADILFTQPSLVLFITLPLLLIPVLYWVRWWVAEPDVWLNTLNPYGN